MRLWHRQIRTKSFSLVGCRSRLIRGWPTTKCTGSCSCRVRRWWSWRYTRATMRDARGWTQLVLHAPLIVGEHGGVAVQVVVGAWRRVRRTPGPDLLADRRDGADRAWTRHAEGVLSPTPEPIATEEFEQWPPEGAEPIDVSEAYPKLAARGYEYGPAFRGLRSVWRRGAEVFVEAALPEQAKADASRFGLHPVLLDAILHGIGCRRHPRGIGADQVAVRMGRRVAACRRRKPGFAPGSRSSATTRLPSL